MIRAYIIKHTEYGKRSYPIDKAEADELVTDGKAKQHNDAVYEEIKPDQYRTKVVNTRKKRGRGRPKKIPTFDS